MTHVDFNLFPFIDNSVTKASNPTLDLNITGTINIDTRHVLISYLLKGDTLRVLHAPQKSPPQRRDSLWKSTCFELFARRHLSDEYWEYNMSTSQDWNVYHFQSYRHEQRLESLDSTIRIHTKTGDNGLINLKASLPLPPQLLGQQLDIGISCVIEDIHNHLHYYALHHHGNKPDFHDPKCFIVNLVHQ